MLRMTSTNGVIAASIIPEWKACEVWSGVEEMPSAWSFFSNTAMSSVGPEATQAIGVLMAAIEIDGGSSRSTCSVGAITASIEPLGMLCISRPRAATARSASSSESTSAMQAETEFSDTVTE